MAAVVAFYAYGLACRIKTNPWQLINLVDASSLFLITWLFVAQRNDLPGNLCETEEENPGRVFINTLLYSIYYVSRTLNSV